MTAVIEKLKIILKTLTNIVWSDEKVLEIDSVDGFISLSM